MLKACSVIGRGDDVVDNDSVFDTDKENPLLAVCALRNTMTNSHFDEWSSARFLASFRDPPNRSDEFTLVVISGD